MSGVWVWIEQFEGQMKAISQEMLGAGRIAAEGLGKPLTAVVLGHNVETIAQAAFDLGADKVLGADDPALDHFRVEAYGPVLAGMAQERSPQAVLFGLRRRTRMRWKRTLVPVFPRSGHPPRPARIAEWSPRWRC